MKVLLRREGLQARSQPTYSSFFVLNWRQNLGWFTLGDAYLARPL